MARLVEVRRNWHYRNPAKYIVFIGHQIWRVVDYPAGGGVRGGAIQISSDKDDWRIFLGLKLWSPGFFWVSKFGKHFFEWLNLSRDFLGVFKTIWRLVVVLVWQLQIASWRKKHKQSISFFFVISFNAFWKFLRLRNSAWDFLGVKFLFRDFLGLCWQP